MIQTETGVLPAATTDPEQALADLHVHGFTLLEGVLSPQETGMLAETLQSVAARELSAGEAFQDGGPRQQWGDFQEVDGLTARDKFRAAAGGVNQRVWMIVNKGPCFVDLLSKEPVLHLVRALLGECFQLSSHGANIARKGGVPMPLHTDQWWMPAPVEADVNPMPVGSIRRDAAPVPPAAEPALIAPCACVNVLWYLRDFSEKTGSTRVVPGSHLFGYQPPADYSETETVSVAGKAGTVLVIDGRIWHGTGANATDNDRLTVLTTFCGPQYRPQENYFVGNLARSSGKRRRASPDHAGLPHLARFTVGPRTRWRSSWTRTEPAAASGLQVFSEIGHGQHHADELAQEQDQQHADAGGCRRYQVPREIGGQDHAGQQRVAGHHDQ